MPAFAIAARFARRSPAQRLSYGGPRYGLPCPPDARRAPAKPWRASISRHALRDPDGFDVDELADAVLRQLAAIARALDPAEGQARVRLHEAVDEHRARFDLGRQPLGPRAVAGPQRGAEAER